jgi:hypothetical protein
MAMVDLLNNLRTSLGARPGFAKLPNQAGHVRQF